MEFFVTCALLILATVLFAYLSKQFRRRTAIPGPKAYPLVGSALQIKPDQIHHTFYDFAKQYGKMFAIQLFDAKLVVLNDSTLVNKAFCKDGSYFNHRQKIFVGEYIDVLDSISFRNADKEHRISRKSFVKGLHVYGSGIPKFERIVNDELKRVMNILEELDGQEFEVVSFIRRSLINILSILLIGEEATEEDVQLFSEYTAGTNFFMNAFTNTTLSHLPFLMALPYYKRQMDRVTLAKQKLQEKFFYMVKETRKPGVVRGLVDCLLQEQEENDGTENFLSDKILKSIVLTDVLTAGTLTTGSALPSIILCLANNPGYQKKIQEEIDRVIGVDNEPKVSEKHECHLLEALFMETTRFLTPDPLLLPHLCHEPTAFEGIEIEKGTQILANVWYIHHDESIWGDPWTFRPERFLDENGRLLPNDHIYIKNWLPFGVGRRACPGIGMATTRIFLYLSTIFQQWSLKPVPGRCGPCDPRSDNFVCELLLNPKPFYCYAKKRSKKKQ